MKPIAQEFGEHLRSLRVKRKLTQKQLARLLGWSQARVSYTERGVSPQSAEASPHGPTLETLALMAERLGISVRDLIPPGW